MTAFHRCLVAAALVAALGLASCSSRIAPLGPPEQGYHQSYSSRLAGNRTIEFALPGKAGQTLTVTMMTDASMFFDVIAPGMAQPLFVGGAEGREFSAVLYIDGAYTLRVYMLGVDAESGKTGNFVLEAILTDPPLM
ncbi:hypothetical protein [Rhodobacteraceae bacterium DSL-40]|uniref:hypothetical protein n=1 Tax=Amaricoccus sp. B4 TaxID=3368557 RepID=UPI000DABF96D